MDTTKLRVGVIGAASIAKKNIRAIAQSKNCVIAGLASRSVEKAKTFLNDLGLSFDVKIFASYESIITSTEIDALYIPLPTILHVEWAKKAAAAGKHILIEKPVALNLNDLQDIIKACHANNCCYMDGVMFMHHRRTAMLGDLLRDPLVSEVQRVSASFSFNAHEEFFKSNIRASSQGDPLGCLGDLGWYCIRIGLFAFNKGQFADAKSIILPKRCTARCLKWTEDGVPLQVDAHISFSEEGWARELVFDNSFISAFRQRYELVCSSRTLSRGDKVVTCDDFVIPRCQKSASFQVETFPNGGTFIFIYLHIRLIDKLLSLF